MGESGSGKSTTGRLVLRLIEPTAGSIELEGKDVLSLKGEELRTARRDMQMVFQDPYSSLDPLATVADIVGEPFQVHFHMSRKKSEEKVVALLEQVGMSAHHLRRFPSEFSGGQRQRIAVARALALEPKLIIADEPVSALDMSTQSQVVNLLLDLQQNLGVAFLFIAHDLSIVHHASDRIAVMYLGTIVEVGEAEEIYNHPRHPYSEALISAIPVPDPQTERERTRIVLAGDPPSPLDPAVGMPLPPAVRVRDGNLHDGRSRTDADRERRHRCLPSPHVGAHAQRPPPCGIQWRDDIEPVGAAVGGLTRTTPRQPSSSTEPRTSIPSEARSVDDRTRARPATTGTVVGSGPRFSAIWVPAPRRNVHTVSCEPAST